jgi:hypothetical protein
MAASRIPSFRELPVRDVNDVIEHCIVFGGDRSADFGDSIGDPPASFVNDAPLPAIMRWCSSTARPDTGDTPWQVR